MIWRERKYTERWLNAHFCARRGGWSFEVVGVRIPMRGEGRWFWRARRSRMKAGRNSIRWNGPFWTRDEAVRRAAEWKP